jgi:hypothetical protein
LPLDSGVAKSSVDLIDQIPRPLVRHIHGATGRRDRSASVNLLKQANLAGPNPAFRIKINANA